MVLARGYPRRMRRRSELVRLLEHARLRVIVFGGGVVAAEEELCRGGSEGEEGAGCAEIVCGGEAHESARHWGGCHGGREAFVEAAVMDSAGSGKMRENWCGGGACRRPE